MHASCAGGLQPGEHRVGVEAELGDDVAAEPVLADGRRLVGQRRPERVVGYRGVALRVAADAYVTDAVALQQSRAQEGEGVLVRALGAGGVAADDEDVLGGAVLRQPGQELLQGGAGGQAARGDVRHGNETEALDRAGGLESHPEVLAGEEGDVDPGSPRDAVARLLQAGHVLAGHLQGEVVQQSGTDDRGDGESGVHRAPRTTAVLASDDDVTHPTDTVAQGTPPGAGAFGDMQRCPT